MIRGPGLRAPCCRLAGVLLLLAFWPGLALATPGKGQLNALEERGREIYFSGRSASGLTITAYFGEDRIAIPGATATCATCHGHDGTGRPESGVIPTNITWRALTKSYGHAHPGGLEHPPFDAESLKTYLQYGDYPGGQPGDPSMPLYEMSDQDLDALVAFLQRLGENLAPGVSAAAVRIGSLLPLSGRLSSMGQAIQGIIAAYFADINRSGGIHGRQLELAVDDLSDQPGDSGQPGQWLEKADLFALVSTFTPTRDEETQALSVTYDIPSIGPITLYPYDRHVDNRNLFFVFSGLPGQVRSLVAYAAEQSGDQRSNAAVVYPERGALTGVVSAADKAARKQGWPELRKLAYPDGAFDAASLVTTLSAANIQRVIFLGGASEGAALLAAAAGAQWAPDLLAPGVLAGPLLRDAPAAFSGRIYLAYPTLPRDRQPQALDELSGLMRQANLANEHLQLVVSAYVSAKLLVHALRLAGKDLDRPKFLAVLEKLYRYETGLTPPLTFSANRRVGSEGCYVVTSRATGAAGREGELAISWFEEEQR